MSAYPRNLAALSLSAAMILTLPGCESSGSNRVAGVNSAGLQGVGGPESVDDDGSGAGGSGSGSGSGSSAGTGGSGSGNLDRTRAVATGGLVGPGGVAGTGLLANTGDPANRNTRVSGVIVASGETASALAARGAPLSQRIDSRTPGGLSITGRVIRTIDGTGQALVRAGNGQEYLVDGLSAAPGQLVTVTANNARLVGTSTQSPLIAGTALSTSQDRGDAATAGAASGGKSATVGTQPTGTTSTTVGQGVVQGTTTTLPPLPRGN